jgi:hypothetical protein
MLLVGGGVKIMTRWAKMRCSNEAGLAGLDFMRHTSPNWDTCSTSNSVRVSLAEDFDLEISVGF